MSNFMNFGNANAVLTEFANAIKNRVLISLIATKETSTTASKAYTTGKYLVLNDVLYKVTSDIAQGGTIVTSGTGANVIATTVGDELGNGGGSGSGDMLASTYDPQGAVASSGGIPDYVGTELENKQDDLGLYIDEEGYLCQD